MTYKYKLEYAASLFKWVEIAVCNELKPINKYLNEEKQKDPDIKLRLQDTECSKYLYQDVV